VRKTLVLAILGIILTPTISSAFALDITLTPISAGIPTPIGIDHYSPTNKVALSVNYASGLPNNFELVAADGTRTSFSTLSGFTDEIKIATARPGSNFPAGTLFTGNGADGQIAKINPDGTFVNPWVTLANQGVCTAPHGLMRGSLYVDRTGVYGGDLIVVTTAGEVWRITSGAVATCIDDVGVHLEGMATVPNDAQFGTLAGKIIAGNEGNSRIYAFDNIGFVNFWTIPFQIEDIDIITTNENFFGVDFANGRLLGAPASEFNSVQGQILIADEGPTGSGLALLKWDSINSVPLVETIGLKVGSASPAQWEHVTFTSAGIKDIPPIEEPVVGGELLPIDTTALVIAGLQSSALWMVPTLGAVAGAGFGLLYFQVKRKH